MYINVHYNGRFLSLLIFVNVTFFPDDIRPDRTQSVEHPTRNHKVPGLITVLANSAYE